MTAISVFDLDSTVSRRDTFLPFLIFMLMRRPSRWWRTPALAYAAAIYFLGLRDNSWLKTFFLTQIVGGMPVQTAHSHAKDFVHTVVNRRLAQDALTEISRCREQGSLLVLATASPDIYVGLLAGELNIPHVICSELVADENGHLTGALRGGNCHGAEKLSRIDDFRLRHDASWADMVVYSDHSSDWALLIRAGRGFAVNPSRALARKCQGSRLPVLYWR